MRVQCFLDRHLAQCACPSPVRRVRYELRAALRHLITVLREAGVQTGDLGSDAVETELRRFDRYMENARGLAANTRVKRTHVLRRFLEQRSNGETVELVPIDGDRLRRFLREQLQHWSPASRGVVANALRSYLRFRIAHGDPLNHLLPLIASPAHWRLAPLPKTLSSAELNRLLSTFPLDIPSRFRAYAMLRCVADLGLRAQEVIDLTLDDLDWHAGIIRIGRNKSRRVSTLPLIAPTGAAIADYLRCERPATRSRYVFVRHVAPAEQPIGPGVVRRAVRDAYQRCGLPYTSVHLLRHTLASRLLASGSTLKEVADLLRHRDLDTSLIYAKIDTVHLAQVALPWPQRAP
jgi:site-specific recombinase XerD